MRTIVQSHPRTHPANSGSGTTKDSRATPGRATERRGDDIMPKNAYEQAQEVVALAHQIRSWSYSYNLRKQEGKPGKREKKALQRRITSLREWLDILEEEINK